MTIKDFLLSSTSYLSLVLADDDDDDDVHFLRRVNNQ